MAFIPTPVPGTTAVNTYERVVLNLMPRIRKEWVNGKEYWVAPLRLIVSGVLNGSQGPLLYPPDEVNKDADAWNDIPMVVYHPVMNGRNVSGRSPQVLQKHKIGRVYNAGAANGILDAEGWFDVEATRRVDSRILNALAAGHPIGLSTGLYTTNVPVPRQANGAWPNYKGKEYHYEARNYRPDHLAILPDQKGACSLQDGCGVLVGNCDCDPAVNATMMEAWLALGYRHGLIQPTGNAPSDKLDMTPEKACKILEDGSVNGKSLTADQKAMFGALCGKKETKNTEPLSTVETTELVVDGVTHTISWNNCGTGGGGFQPGNTCAAGGGGGGGGKAGSGGGSKPAGSGGGAAGPAELREDSKHSLDRLANSLAAGSTIEKSTIAGRIDPSEKTVEAIKYLNTVLASKDLVVVPKGGTSIVQSSRGGGKIGKGTGWVVKKKEVTSNQFTDEQLLGDNADDNYCVTDSRGDSMAFQFKNVEEKKQVIEHLVANAESPVAFGPWKSKDTALLNAMDDGQLQGMNEALKSFTANCPKPGTGGGGGGGSQAQVIQPPKEISNPDGSKQVWNESKHTYEYVAPVGNMGGGAGGLPLPGVPQPKKYSSMKEMLADVGTPQEREAHALAEEVYNQTKAALVGQLVGNREGEARQQAIDIYSRLDIPQLRQLAAGAPQQQTQTAPSQAQTVTNYLGAAGAAGYNPTPNFEPLTGPVYNWENPLAKKKVG